MHISARCENIGGVKTFGGVNVAPEIKSRDTDAMPFYTYILVCPKTNHISHSAFH